MTRLIIPPGMAHAVPQFGYAPGLVSGGFLFMAGQLGRDDAGQVIADPEAQITRAFENVLAILHAAGAGIADLLDVTSFHVGLRETLPLYKTVRDRFMQGHTPPWTAIGVSELSRPGLIVEIKGIARLPA
ncbi:RidA family protein [Sediminicoccus sp. KRV36]|uniref:RidA family protein n=1 Tax=Sediminicoccus sp. KRV36 TaxID=3133721 RepID=UPI00200F03F4|nr:RidA family protein [Sediminicoccus rosea]UPY36283.1 RidA family protein [Sediminicoccus rosea]